MNKTLDELRKEIDTVDQQLVELLAKRFTIVREIGEIKQEIGKDVLDTKRWQQVINNIEQKAKQFHLDTSFVQEIYELIHRHAQKLEKEHK